MIVNQTGSLPVSSVVTSIRVDGPEESVWEEFKYPCKIISYFVSITILSVFLYFYIWIVASTGDYFFFYVKILLRFKFLS